MQWPRRRNLALAGSPQTGHYRRRVAEGDGNADIASYLGEIDALGRVEGCMLDVGSQPFRPSPTPLNTRLLGLSRVS